MLHVYNGKGLQENVNFVRKIEGVKARNAYLQNSEKENQNVYVNHAKNMVEMIV